MPPSVPVTQSPQAPAHLPFHYPCSFPRVRSLSCSVILTDIFTHFLSFPLYSFSLFFIFPKWMRPYNVCPSDWLISQHNTLQFHPCRSKWSVFVISEGWEIFHCIHRPQLLYPLIFRWTPRLLPQFGYCGHCCYKHWGAGVLPFHCICIFGVNPQQCNCWVIR